MDNLKIIIVGHVDHGKSTLIGRLILDTDSLPEEKLHEIKRISRELGKDTELAYLTDQLKEEREKNMTIDTTQIFFKTHRRNYVIIDSPGHVEFLKNMLTGATQADAAVLIVDTHEGVKEQTRRHAYLIDMLGIKNIVVVFNKMDLLGYQEEKFNQVKTELWKFFDSLRIKPSYAIPISAKEGINISKKSPKTRWYKGPALLEALDSIIPEARKVNRPLRIPIQDIYEIDGEKIVVGQVLSGEIAQGESVILSPSLKKTRVNAIRIFGETPKRVSEGKNIGLVLAEPEIAKRGEVIAQTQTAPQPTDRFRADIFWMDEVPLELSKPVTFKCATQEVKCIAEKIERRMDSSTLEILEENAKELKVNETGKVIFKTEKPVVIEKFDFIEDLGRFVIESNENLQGAGIITGQA